MPARRPAAPILILIAALVLALTACDEPSPSPAGPSAPSSTQSAPASSAPTAPPATASQPATESPTADIADEPPPLALEEVGRGFASPINIATAPNGWLLVNEQAGRVVALDPASGATRVALDISDHVRSGGEQGLLGLALHPDWPRVERAFVHYTGGDGRTVLSEFAAIEGEGGAPVLDAGSERIVLEQAQPYSNHNGGQLAFGPDGYLWMALGDGGLGGDPQGNGQNPDTLLGAILRLDVDSAGADGRAYGIPPDNPFADGGGAPEVYFMGLRNPWRFSFDTATDQVWIGDVGQGAYEEIDRIGADQAGANFGWNILEASHCYASRDCSSDGTVLPVAEYGRDAGCAVVGGFVYRGDAIPGLWGWYLASDNCSGLLFGLRSDAEGVIVPDVLLETGTNASSFGQDAGGELYLADRRSGSIYRVVAGG